MNKLIKVLGIFLISSLLFSRATGTIRTVESVSFLPETTEYYFILMQDGKKVSEDKFYLEWKRNGARRICWEPPVISCGFTLSVDNKPHDNTLYLFKKQHEFPYETYVRSDGRVSRTRVLKKEDSDELVAILDLPYLGESVYRYGIVDLDKVGPDKVATFQQISKQEYEKAYNDPDYLPRVAFIYTEFARVLMQVGILVIAIVIFFLVRRWVSKKRKKSKNA